jgi:bacterioferritin
MKGNDELVQALNGLLADELTSINQHVVHAEMAEHWGYP